MTHINPVTMNGKKQRGKHQSGVKTASTMSEHGEQVRVIKHLRLFGKDNLVMFSVPNGARRSMNEAAIKKAEGMMAGVADLIIVHLGLVYFLEMKRAKGGVQSVNQLRFQLLVTQAGAKYAVARGFDEAIEILNGWGLLK